MSCLLTAGIERGCNSNAGGIKRVLIQNKSEITAVTPALAGDTTGKITSLTLQVGAQFFQFEPTRDSSDAVENIQSNVVNGTFGFEQIVNLTFKKNEADLRNKVLLMAQANPLVIVEDRNGKYWLYGEESGMELTGGNSATGKVLTDLNGWILALSSMSSTPAREIYVTSKALTDAYIATLLEPAV